MTRRDTFTPTVEAAVGHEWKHHPEPIDRDVPSAGDLVPETPRTTCTQYIDPFEGPIRKWRWAHIFGCDRRHETPDDRRCGDETCEDEHA